MPRKNIVSLHEAIAIALLYDANRELTFEEIATIIEDRNLSPNRDGNIPLSTQVMLRATKSGGAYSHWFALLNGHPVFHICNVRMEVYQNLPLI